MLKKSLLLIITALACSTLHSTGADNIPPEGFTALFNGKDLSGFYGWGTRDPRDLAKLSPAAVADYKKKSVEGGTNPKGKPITDHLNAHWKVENGELVNDGDGLYATTEKEFGDFELLVDYKMQPKGDSGIYLRGVPQVQIWDFTKEGGKWNLGADKGSGGLWNNSPGAPGKDPLVLADKPFGEWNHFRIVMKGERVSVWLNDKLVVDDAVMENYFEKKKDSEGKRIPIFARGPIQLQTHGSEIRWKNIFIKELK